MLVSHVDEKLFEAIMGKRQEQKTVIMVKQSAEVLKVLMSDNDGEFVS